MQYDSDYEVRLATLAALGGNTGVTYDSVYEIDLEILRLTEQGGGGGGTGTSIDDTVTSTTKTWSSSKINNELAGKQGALTAGDNITIADGVISASQPDLSGYALSADVATELADKEDKAPDAMLRAAMNQDDILVDYSPINSFTSGVYRIGLKMQMGPDSEIVVGYGHVVAIDASAFVGATAYLQYITFDAFPIEGVEMDMVIRMYRDGAWGDAVKFVRPFIDDDNLLYMPNKSTYSATKIDSLLSGKQTTLTAGTNVTIQNNVISAQQPDLSNYTTFQDLNNGLSFKQDTLTAGTGINLVNSVISAESEIDDLHAGSATTYSSNKIIELTQGLGFDVEIVQALPQTGDAQTIYMLPKADSAATDVYDEYIYTNDAWEKIGNTQTDLSQYYTKSETDTLLGGKQTTLTAGTGIQIVDNVISATGGGGTELSAGTNISIVDNKINANGYNYDLVSGYGNLRLLGGSVTWGGARYVVVEGTSHTIANTSPSSQHYDYSHIEGSGNTLNGYVSQSNYLKAAHIEGVVNTATTSCFGSHIEGSGNTAVSANTCHVEGVGNEARNHGGEHAEGRFNKSHKGSVNYLSDDATRHSIGIGTSASDRKNALEVMANGDIYVYGAGGYDGNNLSGSTLQQLLAGGGGQSLSAGTNISIQNDLINALGYEYDSTLNAVKIGAGLNASGNNSVIVGQYNRSRTTSSGDTIFAVGVGTGTDNANRTNAIETLSNGKTYVKGVGGYTGQGMSGTKPLDEAINEKVSSTSVVSIWSGTQAQYDALGSYSNDVLYLIK